MITLGHLQLESRIMNAAGPWASDKKQLASLYNSNIGAVVTKTFTLQASGGNEEPNLYFDACFSINSVGLKNKGANYFAAAHRTLGNKKPIIASIAEQSLDRFLKLARQVGDRGFSAIELNLSCPNVTTKEPIAYDAGQLDTLLKAIFKATTLPVAVKIPPYVTRSHLTKITEVLSKYPINHLIAINTYPFASAFVNAKPVIVPNNGIGGLGGSYLKPIALAHVILLQNYLPDIPVVAVGGISTASDVEDFLQAGATAIQVGTAIHNQGVELLDELATQF